MADQLTRWSRRLAEPESRWEPPSVPFRQMNGAMPVNTFVSTCQETYTALRRYLGKSRGGHWLVVYDDTNRSGLAFHRRSKAVDDDIQRLLDKIAQRLYDEGVAPSYVRYTERPTDSTVNDLVGLFPGTQWEIVEDGESGWLVKQTGGTQ